MSNLAKIVKQDVVYYLKRERNKDYKKQEKLSDELLGILACYDEEKAEELAKDEPVIGRTYHKALEELEKHDLSEDHRDRILGIACIDHDLDVEIRLFDRLINYVDRMKGIKE